MILIKLLSECTMLLLGVPIGYSLPNTMTNQSTAIKPGQQGDAILLRPTFMRTVPLILDHKEHLCRGRQKGPLFKRIFDYC